MRKIQEDVYTSVISGTPMSKQNTVFAKDVENNDGWTLFLHGHAIAHFDRADPHPEIPVLVSLAGYPTKTTLSRLNALPGVVVKIKGGVPYLNGKEIDSEGWWNPRNLTY